MTKKLYLAIAIIVCAPICARATAKWRQMVENIKPVPLSDYEAEYPIFAEASAMTTFKEFMPNKPGCKIASIHDFNKYNADEQAKCIDGGGGGGHAVLFLRGACLIPNSPYPKMYNCSNDPAVMSDPNSGVGISTNEIFFNVAWVGIPGRQLFYYGNVQPNEDLSKARYDGLIKKILNLDYYHGILMNPRFLNLPERPAHISDQEWLVDQSIGTDFGSALGRTVLFSRVPLSSRELDRMIAFLNDINRKFFEGYKDHDMSYWWDIVLNNCSHTVNNAFAAAGLVREKDPINFGAKTDHPKGSLFKDGIGLFKQIFHGNIAVPSNIVIDVGAQTSRVPFQSLVESYNDEWLRRMVTENELMVGPGTLVGANLMHSASENEEFLAGSDPFILGVPDFLPLPIFSPARRRDHLYTQAKTTELAANRAYFETKIKGLLQEAQSEMRLAAQFRSYQASGQDVDYESLSLRDRELFDVCESNHRYLALQKFAAAYVSYLRNELSRLQNFDSVSTADVTQ